ncbi:MAG: hypothetical protein ACK55I_00465, partial [bacterium]
MVHAQSLHDPHHIVAVNNRHHVVTVNHSASAAQPCYGRGHLPLPLQPRLHGGSMSHQGDH